MWKDAGTVLDSAVLEQGLHGLCSDLHFDMGGKLNLIHPYINDRQGVFYHGMHICSMDRGPSPEFKLWSVVEAAQAIEWSDADKDDASIQYKEVGWWEPDYEDLWRLAESGRDNGIAIQGGKLVRRWPVRVIKAKGSVVRVGWRHTFERILNFGVPGVTRRTLSDTFGVDMMKYPQGQDLVDALLEE